MLQNKDRYRQMTGMAFTRGLFMKKAILLSIITGIAFQCGQNNAPDKAIPAAKFQLADGSPISQPSTDEYNPSVVIDNSGYMILVFGSDRGYGVVSAGTEHNLYISKSLSPADYFSGIPAFSAPQVLKIANLALGKNVRISFAVRYKPTTDDVVIYFTDSADFSKVKSVVLNPTAVSNGLASGSTVVQKSGPTDRQGTVLAVQYHTESMVNLLYREADGSLVLGDPDTTPVSDNSLSNADIGSKSGVGFIPDFVSGASNSYFYTAWDSSGSSGGMVMAAQNDASIGGPEQLNVALEENGLKATYVSGFHDPYFALTGMTFSAGDSYDGLQDLYIINSHDLYGLWLLALERSFYVDYGDYTPGPPAIVYAELASITSAQAVLHIYFDQPVYSSTGMSGPLTTASFSTGFGYTDPNASLPFLSASIYDITGAAVSGGETAFKVRVDFSAGTRTGDEVFVITPNTGTSIYGMTDLPMSASSSYGPINLPGALAAPQIMGGFLSPNNQMLYIQFDQPVWGVTFPSPLGPSHFSFTFNPNGGNVCGATISSVKQMDGTSNTVGGENMVTLILSNACTGSGLETFTVTPANGASIYNGDNAAMTALQTTGPVFLNLP